MPATPQQLAVVEKFKKQDSLAIRAVAGSGKTTTLVMAFQFAPEDSLCVAFNKRNAEDLAKKMPSHVVSKTMNALGHAAWMKHLGRKVILDSNKLFNLIKSAPFYKEIEENAVDIIRMVRLAKSFGVSSGWNLPAPDLESWLDLADEFDIEDGANLLPYAQWLLQENCKTAFRGEIDFDDQIYMPVMYGSPFKRYNCVAVDEAQDLSFLQHKMIEKSLKPEGQLVIVGDPNQAIYAWRGASSNSFFDLTEKFSLETLSLTLSFRCPRDVVAEAKKYVPDIEAASSESGSVSFSSAIINPAPGIAVLSRTNAPLVKLAFSSIRNRIAVNYSGKDFLSGIKTLNKKYPTLKDLERWKNSELAKTNLSETKKIRILDRFEALAVLHESGNVKDAIAKLTKTPVEESLILSTIHKAKGMEWNHVVYLDYHKQWRGEQENNVKYVGCTRAMKSLLLQGEQN
jgi:superfamily I DNA/RNA helicase